MSLQTKLQGLVDGKTAVVNSINAKAETSLTINSKWSDLVSAVDGITTGGGGGVDIEPIVLTRNCEYACGGRIAANFIELFPNKLSTSDITIADYMFIKSTLTEIPFDINCDPDCDYASLTNCFYRCKNLTALPKILNLRVQDLSYAFAGCELLTEIPEDIADTWDWTNRKNPTWYPNLSYLNAECKRLRKLPYFLYTKIPPEVNGSYSYFNGLCYQCTLLDEAVNLPIPYTSTWTSNAFGSVTERAYRLKNFTFALNPETNQPYVMNWKSQTLSFNSSGCGWALNAFEITDYGIGEDKRVTDAASYEALKNDPDWFTTDPNYSRYNHDSAVATINSLPDTSAYLAANGGTNTIRFKGTAGALTDGGAINTLTEDEIAVATAKGWTVVLQ